MAGAGSYVICTAPRSGSTLLCLLLAETGVAGTPKSYFHSPSVARWAASLHLALDAEAPRAERLTAVFAAAQRQGRTGAGPFGLRLQAHSLDFFRQQLDALHPGAASDREKFEATFGPARFLHLRRAGKVDQAVSYVMAEQTGLWHAASDGREIERTRAPARPVYDAEAIRAAVAQMTAYDHLWAAWFANEGIAPLTFDYDGLAKDPRATLRSVLGALTLDPATADAVTIPTMKLANTTSRDWIARFQRESGET